MKDKGFTMYRTKTTDYKVRYRHAGNRIGNIYLPIPVVKRMGLGDEITVHLASEKSEFEPGGYVTVMYPYDTTKNKVKFKESPCEQGVLDVIYVAKEVLEEMGYQGEIAVQIIKSSQEETGGEKLARSST